jgi:translation initiation factor IF-3
MNSLRSSHAARLTHDGDGVAATIQFRGRTVIGEGAAEWDALSDLAEQMQQIEEGGE